MSTTAPIQCAWPTKKMQYKYTALYMSTTQMDVRGLNRINVFSLDTPGVGKGHSPPPPPPPSVVVGIGVRDRARKEERTTDNCGFVWWA